MALLKFFKYDLLITLVALVVAMFYGGVSGAVSAAILIVLEIVFSFDNAGVNAKYLNKMSHAWRRIFLTVGVLVAVFGMRLVFPFLIVCLAGNVGPVEAWNLAMERGDPHTPGTYGYILESAHHTIASFGGMFLLMLFLSFLFEAGKDVHWLAVIERPLAKAGHFDSMPVLVSGAILLAAAQLFGAEHHEQYTILLSGLLGMLTFLATNGLATFMEDRNEAQEESLSEVAMLTGKAAFSMFIFLEVLDASFSFDGVLGAFAVTSDPIIIAIGLGVGALFVRSMTIYLVEKGTLQELRYLDHGAHWAIGVLALMLIATLKWDIPDYVIGLSGIVFIAGSVISSRRANRAEATENDGDAKEPVASGSSTD